MDQVETKIGWNKFRETSDKLDWWDQSKLVNIGIGWLKREENGKDRERPTFWSGPWNTAEEKDNKLDLLLDRNFETFVFSTLLLSKRGLYVMLQMLI